MMVLALALVQQLELGKMLGLGWLGAAVKTSDLELE
jgi:hypothetical protein